MGARYVPLLRRAECAAKLGRPSSGLCVGGGSVYKVLLHWSVRLNPVLYLLRGTVRGRERTLLEAEDVVLYSRDTAFGMLVRCWATVLHVN